MFKTHSVRGAHSTAISMKGIWICYTLQTGAQPVHYKNSTVVSCNQIQFDIAFKASTCCIIGLCVQYIPLCIVHYCQLIFVLYCILLVLRHFHHWPLCHSCYCLCAIYRSEIDALEQNIHWTYMYASSSACVIL